MGNAVSERGAITWITKSRLLRQGRDDLKLKTFADAVVSEVAIPFEQLNRGSGASVPTESSGVKLTGGGKSRLSILSDKLVRSLSLLTSDTVRCKKDEIAARSLSSPRGPARYLCMAALN